MDTRQVLAQLQRRGVYRVAALYSAAAWGLLQIADVLFPIIGLGEGSITVLLLTALAGFPISLVLAWIFDLTPQGIVETPPGDIDPERFSLSPRRIAMLSLITLLILLVGYLYIERLVSQPETRDSLTVQPNPIPGVDKASIAVMPFVNFSDVADMGYFGDGLAEEILNLLAKLGELSVSARTSSFYFKNKDVDILTIARHLGVQHVLEGSVRHDGKRIRVTAQLIDAQNGFHLWSETYDRDLSNIFSLQDEIAAEVVKNLRVILSASSRGVLEREFTIDPRAYDYYLRGRDYLRQPQSNLTLNNAEQMFMKAAALEPEYANAYAGLCDTLLLQYFLDFEKARFAAAEKACQRAQALDSLAPAVHIALGNLYRGSGQYGLAEQEFNSAISLQGNAVDAYVGLSETFEAQGKHSLAEQTLVRAIELQPNNWAATMALGRHLFNVGRVEESIPYFQRIDDLLPENGAGSNNLGAAYFLSGQFEEAASAWQDSLGRSPTVNVYSSLGSSYFFLGRYEQSAQMYTHALQMAPEHFEVWGSLGDAYSHSTKQSELAPAAYGYAIKLAREHLRINPSDAATLSLMGHYLARMGERTQAMTSIDSALQLAQKDMFVYSISATALCTLGELDRAIDVIGEAISLGYPLHLVESDAGLSPLRGLPQYESMMARARQSFSEAPEGDKK